MSSPVLLFDGPEEAPLTLALAHGAGAPMDSPFMNFFARQLGEGGLRVARFEFPYMTARRESGVQRPPDRLPILEETWRAVIADLGPGQLLIGGKSMGGRVASLVADSAGVRGVVCLGYPFHPAGRPQALRTEHLEAIATPTLILQGTRDALGSRDDVSGYSLSPAIRLHWAEDGDHHLAPRKSSGRTAEQNWDEACAAILAFARELEG